MLDQHRLTIPTKSILHDSTNKLRKRKIPQNYVKMQQQSSSNGTIHRQMSWSSPPLALSTPVKSRDADKAKKAKRVIAVRKEAIESRKHLALLEESLGQFSLQGSKKGKQPYRRREASPNDASESDASMDIL